MASFLLAVLLWLCHNFFSGMKLQNHVKTYNLYLVHAQCILCYLLYLVVVEKVHENLHDAGEDHQAGAGDEEDVDVVK